MRSSDGFIKQDSGIIGLASTERSSSGHVTEMTVLGSWLVGDRTRVSAGSLGWDRDFIGCRCEIKTHWQAGCHTGAEPTLIFLILEPARYSTVTQSLKNNSTQIIKDTSSENTNDFNIHSANSAPWPTWTLGCVLHMDAGLCSYIFKAVRKQKLRLFSDGAHTVPSSWSHRD